MIETARRVVPLVLLALLVGSIATIRGPATTAFAQNEVVDFAANIEFIRGHLEMAVANKNAGNTELALAHAGHPVEEVYTLVEGQIEAQDSSLNAELGSALVDLANNIDTMEAADVESAAGEIDAMLDDAMAAVVGDQSGEPAFWAQVAKQLLETAALEYGEAVANGQVVEEIEYQDASAFMSRAKAAFDAIKAEMAEHEAQEVEEFFEELSSLVTENADPADVETVIGGINHEFDEVFGTGGAQVDSEALTFASNIEMIKGHLSQAVINIKAGETELALAHAGHPIEEHYAILEPQISERTPELNTQLKSRLTDFANNIDSLSANQARAQEAGIIRLMYAAMAEVVPAETWSDHVFRAAVINSLIATTGEEYSEAIENGEVVEMIEYQDAEAFASRASMQFRVIEDELPENEAEETEEFLADLRGSMNDAQDPEAIRTLVDGIIQELQEATGLGAEEGETTSLQYIENIEPLLAELEQEYAAGEYSRADSLAVQAYLDNFEFVEDALVEAGEEDLMLEIEQLMRVQLRELIADQVPADEVSAHIDLILEKLELAEQALS